MKEKKHFSFAFTLLISFFFPLLFLFSFLGESETRRAPKQTRSQSPLLAQVSHCFVLPEPVLCARGVRWYRQKEASARDKVRMEIESEKKSRRKMVPLFFQSVRCCSTSDPPRRSSDGCHRWP